MFSDWMVFRDVATLLGLLEDAQYFDPAAYNQVFDGQLGKLIHRLPDGEARQTAMAMKGFDWAGYIARSLRRAGVKDDDALQEGFHSIAVRLLVSPGKLFVWNPERHGPLERRFRRSVWNAIRNIVQKRQNWRKWMTTADPSIMADRMPSKAPHNNIIGEFRQLVLQRLGKLALAILDARLSDEELKGLVGRSELGSPSAYQLKREVGEVKRLAHQFAAQSGNSEFLRLVNQAFDAEAVTIAKRQAARQAATAFCVGILASGVLRWQKPCLHLPQLNYWCWCVYVAI